MTKLKARRPKQSFKDILINNALVVIILVMVVYVAFNSTNFISFGNLKNILANTSVRFIIALGVSGCLIIKGTDLSAGRIVGLTAVVSATLLQRADIVGKFYPQLGELHWVVGLIAAILVGLVFGLFNGIIVAYFNVPAFIGTLGAQMMIYGINMLYSNSIPIGQLTQDYSDIGIKAVNIFGYDTGWLPNLTIWAIVIGGLMYILYNHTRHGKYMYAIGGNEQAAEVSGVNTAFTKLKIFALAGVLYGIAGFLLTAKTGSTSINAGTGYELEAIASATIGGVSTTGGVGTIPGILLGVLVFELLKTSLQFLNVSIAMTNVIQGLVIVIAVALDIRKTMRKK